METFGHGKNSIYDVRTDTIPTPRNVSNKMLVDPYSINNRFMSPKVERNEKTNFQNDDIDIRRQN